MKSIMYYTLGVVFLYIILYTSIVSATLPSVGQNSCIRLVAPLNATSVILSTVTYPFPNNTVLSINQPMTNSGNGTFNYTWCNTSIVGDYAYIFQDNLGNTFGNDFFVTPNGATLDTPKAVLYSLIFMLGLFMFLITLGVGLFLPAKNKKDAYTGYVLAVNNLKYLKVFMLAISYLMLMLIAYFGATLSFNFLELSFLGNLFRFLFTTLVVAITPLFIVGVYVVIANWVRDSKIQDQLTMGLAAIEVN